VLTTLGDFWGKKILHRVRITHQARNFLAWWVRPNLPIFRHISPKNFAKQNRQNLPKTPRFCHENLDENWKLTWWFWGVQRRILFHEFLPTRAGIIPFSGKIGWFIGAKSLIIITIIEHQIWFPWSKKNDQKIREIWTWSILTNTSKCSADGKYNWSSVLRLFWQ